MFKKSLCVNHFAPTRPDKDFEMSKTKNKGAVEAITGNCADDKSKGTGLLSKCKGNVITDEAGKDNGKVGKSLLSSLLVPKAKACALATANDINKAAKGTGKAAIAVAAAWRQSNPAATCRSLTTKAKKRQPLPLPKTKSGANLKADAKTHLSAISVGGFKCTISEARSRMKHVKRQLRL